MARQQQIVESHQNKPTRQKDNPESLIEKADEQAVLNALSRDLLGQKGGASIRSQAARLADPHIQTVQRQALAARLGNFGGNQYLHTVLVQMSQDDEPRPGEWETYAPVPAAEAIQLAQDPAAARQSRLSLATSVQFFRTTYPDSRGGQLTQRLLTQLRRRTQSVAQAVGTVGAGNRTFGAAPAAGEERAGVTLGQSTAGTGAPSHRAVVVGNGVYDPTGTMGHTVEPLRNIDAAVSEAGTMASTLQTRGYDVRHQDNQTANEINGLLQAGIGGLVAGDELVFYYHGHGTIEGLIGRDGSVYTPAQLTSLRSTARGAQVDLTVALEGCHTGVFADAIRGAELRDTLAALQARLGAASGGETASLQALIQVLDQAIAIQGQKDAFTTQARTWWERRYEIEQQMAASPDDMALVTAWEGHYTAFQTLWNDFVAAITPLLAALQASAAAASITSPAPPRIATLSGTFDQDSEQAVQAGLDDLDAILNSVLQAIDSRLR